MREPHWQYYFARKFSLQRFQVVLQVFTLDFFRKHFGVHIKNIMVKPEEGGNYAIWIDAKEYREMLKKVFVVVCNNLKRFYYYKRMIKQVQKQWVEKATWTSAKARVGLSNKELGKLYDVFLHHHQEFNNKPIWIPFPIESLLADAAEKALTRVLTRSHREREHDQWFQVIFAPEEKNAITAATEAMLNVAITVKRGKVSAKKRRALLERVARTHGFIPCYDVIDVPWDVEHFADELSDLLKRALPDLIRERNDIRTRFTKRRRDFQRFLKSVRMAKRERELFIMAHELVFIKDDRDDHRRLGSCRGRPLFAEIGRRLGLTLREACYLTIEETKAFLHRGIVPDIATVKERMKGFLLLRKHGKKLVVASGDALKIILRNEFGKSHEHLEQTVKGLTGREGKATGKVVIVRTKHDLRRIFQGAIMVAVTTNPDFVPAMKKCRAIVTDEGGITAHAAIVARELGIPCVVGTKTATRVFKDNDTIEVDATRGVVKKV